MTKLKTINEIKKGCNKNHYDGFENTIINCKTGTGELCPICQAQLQTSQNIYDEIEKIINLSDKDSDLWGLEELMKRINGEEPESRGDNQLNKFVERLIDEPKNLEEEKEKPYPTGHCWEGLTPSQVNEGYKKEK